MLSVHWPTGWAGRGCTLSVPSGSWVLRHSCRFQSELYFGGRCFLQWGGAAGGIYVLAMMACGQRFRGKHLLRMTALMGSVWGVASIAGPLVTGSLMSQNSKWSIPAVVFFMAACLAASLAYEKFRKFGPHKDFSHA